MRRRDQPSIRPPQISMTTWSSCSLTSSRTRLRAAIRPVWVLIFRRLVMTTDMIQRRRDQVRGCSGAGSGLWPRSGAIARRSLSCRATWTSNIGLFTWSTISSADRGRRIKSEIANFSRFRCGFDLANPTKKTKPTATSGSRTALFSFSRALDWIWSLRNHQTGGGRLEKSPIRRGPLAEAGRLPGAYALTLSVGLPGQQRPSDGLCFSTVEDFFLVRDSGSARRTRRFCWKAYAKPSPATPSPERHEESSAGSLSTSSDSRERESFD